MSQSWQVLYFFNTTGPCVSSEFEPNLESSLPRFTGSGWDEEFDATQAFAKQINSIKTYHHE